jgi:hypothetical protein
MLLACRAAPLSLPGGAAGLAGRLRLMRGRSM